MMIVTVYETDEQAQLAMESLGEAGITVTFEDVLVPLPGEARPARVGLAVISPHS